METLRRHALTLALAGIIVSMLGTTMLAASSSAFSNTAVSPLIPPGSETAAEATPPLVKESTSPRPNVPVPANAIVTPEGGYVTPLQTTDEHGKPLNIQYLTNVTTGTGGDIVPACRGPNTGLYQEGTHWTVTANSQRIGYQTNWRFPTGSLTGTSVGIFWNPVNFRYPASSPNYDFFQVDYGMGNNLGSRSGWIMTYSYVDGSGVRQYPFTTLTGVTATGNATYTVAAMLQPYPLANPSSYVVQITQGSNSWIRSQALGYTPALGSTTNFDSYQDEYLLSSGSATVSSDTVSSPKVIRDSSGTLVYDGTLVTGKTFFDNLNGAYTGQSRDIYSPSSVSTTSYNDLRECNSWS